MASKKHSRKPPRNPDRIAQDIQEHYDQNFINVAVEPGVTLLREIPADAYTLILDEQVDIDPRMYKYLVRSFLDELGKHYDKRIYITGEMAKMGKSRAATEGTASFSSVTDSWSDAYSDGMAKSKEWAKRKTYTALSSITILVER